MKNISISEDGTTVTIDGQEYVKKEVKEKPNKEERFLELVNGLSVIPKGMSKNYPDSIFYVRGENVVFELINSTLCVRYYGFWDVFEKEFSMQYSEIQSFIKSMVEEHLKMEGITPVLWLTPFQTKVEEHLKMEGITPLQLCVIKYTTVEEHLKMEGITPKYPFLSYWHLVEEHLKMEGITPMAEVAYWKIVVEEHLKMEGITPWFVQALHFVEVEEHLKMEGITPESKS